MKCPLCGSLDYPSCGCDFEQIDLDQEDISMDLDDEELEEEFNQYLNY